MKGSVKCCQQNYTEFFIFTASVRENHKALNDVTDSDIIAAGEDSYSPEPNVTLNKIIIPIAIAVLFVLLIITVALYYYR